MDFLYIILISLIEGITEFLPVSSTAHMLIFSRIYEGGAGINSSFIIAIQSGAMFAMLLSSRKQVFSLCSSIVKKDKQYHKLLLKLIIASAPVFILGFCFYKIIKIIFQSTFIIGFMLAFGGIITIIVAKLCKPKPINDITEISIRKSIIIGIAQAIALIPGASRSACTIVGGGIAGVPRHLAIEFSFLLGMPIIFSATIFEIYKQHDVIMSTMPQIALGMLLSFIFSIVGIKLLKVIAKNENTWMTIAIYRIIAGIAICLFLK